MRRAACIDRAVAVKRAEGLPARIGPRVEEVIANARAEAAAGGLDPALVEDSVAAASSTGRSPARSGRWQEVQE